LEVPSFCLVLSFSNTSFAKLLYAFATGLFLSNSNILFPVDVDFAVFIALGISAFISLSHIVSDINVQEDIKPFIVGLNNLFGKLADDEEFIYVSTHLQDDKEITEE
jgi:hypothetical protein